MRQGSTLRFLLSDHLGSTTHVLDSAGGQVSYQRYYPYGRTHSGGVGTDKRFTGHQIESSGLYFMKARFYDPQLGRFIQADSITPNAADPQSLNRYSYVVGNPLRYTDPTGRYHSGTDVCLLHIGCDDSGGVDCQGYGCAVVKAQLEWAAFVQWVQELADAGCSVSAAGGGLTVWCPSPDPEPTTHPEPSATPCPAQGCPAGPAAGCIICDAAGSIGGAIVAGSAKLGTPVLKGTAYCVANFFPECIERIEMAGVGVAVTYFGVVIVAGGGCALSVGTLGPATAGVGAVAGCGLSIFAGGTVAVGGVLITRSAFSEWHHRDERR